MIVATMAAILGHSYSPYIGFKGGKGVATAAGALLVLTPHPWPILFLTWLLVVALFRMVSLGFGRGRDRVSRCSACGSTRETGR